MREQSIKNKAAWEHRAYEFWHQRDGSPKDKADSILKNPRAALKKHQEWFESIEGKRIANLCGSNGRKAVPLALLGAEVTVFDISEENKRYALELAEAAQVSIEYVVTDIYEIDLATYGGQFDMLYLEGGILHYFGDIQALMELLYKLLKQGGVMILSDFHPLKRCLVLNKDNEYEVHANYFDQLLHDGDVAYKSFFNEEEQKEFPNTSLWLYTLSEIINSVIKAGFTMNRFDEHRGWNNENIPSEFTLLASKRGH